MKTYIKLRTIIDYLLATVFAFYVYWRPNISIHFFTWPSFEDFSGIAREISSVSFSLLGFVFAANVFLISHIQNDNLRLIRGEGSYRQLVDIMSSAIWRLLLLGILSLLSMFMGREIFHFTLAALAGVSLLSFLAIVTLVWVSVEILKIRTN